MKNYTCLIAFFIFLYQCTFGQVASPPPLPSGWERIYIKDVGSFDLPPTMEIQKGKYKEFNDKYRKINGYDATQITAQQKGLNEYGKVGFERYARVMLETSISLPGEFEKLNFDISKIQQSEIRELNETFKQQTKKSIEGTSLKLIEWYPVKFERINGMSYIHCSYKRQLDDKPYVLVHKYIFQNYDRMHNLTLSYRLSESNIWKSDFETLLKSFIITNVK